MGAGRHPEEEAIQADSLLNHDEIVAALTSKWGSTQVMPELLQSADF